MTTVRLNRAQKRKLREAAALLEAQRGRRVTQGEVIAEALDFALRHRIEWLQRAEDTTVSLRDDPLFDPRITFDMGKTDSSRLDSLIYGGD